MKQRNQTVQHAKQGNSKCSLASWGNFLLARMDGQPFHVRKKVFGSFSKTSQLIIFIFSFRYYSSLPYFPVHLSDFLKFCSTKCLAAMNSTFLLDITQVTGLLSEFLGRNGQGLFYAEWRTGLDQILDNMWCH